MRILILINNGLKAIFMVTVLIDLIITIGSDVVSNRRKKAESSRDTTEEY